MSDTADFFEMMGLGPPPPEDEELDSALSFLREFVASSAEAPLSALDDSGMPGVLVRSLNTVTTSGWTYNPRSDRHSVIKCVGMFCDLVAACPTLGNQLRSGEVVFGINSRVGRKDLDLVIGRPGIWRASRRPRSLGDIIRDRNIDLDADGLSGLLEGLVKHPLVAVEAKAVMTDHAGALPRVTDELERFRQRVQKQALTVGLVLVNEAPLFVSPGRNGYDPGRRHKRTNVHKQPHDAQRVVETLSTLPRRVSPGGEGFDGVGVVFVRCQNDGTPVELGGQEGGELSYHAMVAEVARRYERLSV